MSTLEPSETWRPPPPPARPDDGHKGTFGTVIVVGGSAAMPHAPAICARAAFRSGCGLVKLAAYADVLPAALLTEPSATGIRLDSQDRRDGELAALDAADPDQRAVLAVGPGLGGSPADGPGSGGGGGGDRHRIERLVVSLLHGHRPVVMDADALNLLAATGQRHAPTGPPCVLTPHPGEYRRLARAAGIEQDPIAAESRPAAAEQLARFHHAVVVLKGHRTVVSDGRRSYINPTGNPALATAGTGDVLTGVIAALMAQGLEPFDAAGLGVELHGAAGDAWAKRHGVSGLLARELADELPGVFQCARQHG